MATGNGCQSAGPLAGVRLAAGRSGAGAGGRGRRVVAGGRGGQGAQAGHEPGEQLVTFLARVLLQNLIPDQEKTNTFSADLQEEAASIFFGSVSNNLTKSHIVDNRIIALSLSLL